MRLGTSFRTLLEADAAFAYLSDFASIEEWDPFIRRAERLDPGPPRVGSRYHLEGRFIGRSVALDYKIVELDARARRVKLIGSGGRFYTGWDEITVAPMTGGGSTIRYEADITLHGRTRLMVLLAPLGFLLGGRRALDGMGLRLDSMAGRAKHMGMLEAVAAGFDTHDLDAIMAHFSDDAVFETPRGPDPWGRRVVGREAVRAAFADRFAGIPDVRYQEDEHFVDLGADRGASEWTLRGTTIDGERLEVRGCDLWTFRDGKVVRKDSFWKIRTPPT